METRNSLLIAAALLAVAGIHSTASASLVAYEPFSQTAGNVSGIEGSTTSDTFGFMGNWASVGDGNTTSIPNANLSSPYALPSEDNEVQFSQPSTDLDEEQRTLSTGADTTLGTGTSVFVSYLIQLNNVGSSSSPTAMMKLFDSTGATQILAFGYNPINFGTTTDWGIKFGTTSFATTVVATTTTTMLVAELDYNGTGKDSVEYYIGNSNTGGLTEVYQSPTNLTLAASVGVVQLFVQNNGNAASPIFDEIRVGTTLADVAAPEPASLGLLAAVGAVGLLRRRRRANT